jgi:tetratricopeptide (TPR) repeat protein
MYNRTVTRWLVTIASLALPIAVCCQEAEQLSSAYAHLQEGDAAKTIRECKSVLAANPRSAPAHMLLGQAYLSRGDIAMIAEAKAELQQALDLDAGLIWARFYLARVYLDQGINEKAKEQLERGLKDRPDVPHFLSLLGEVDRKLGNPSASLELNRRALAADPNLTPAHYYLALAHLDLMQDEAAAAELEAAVHSPYGTPEMYVALADLYIKRHKFVEAEDLCRKAIALDRSRPESHLTLARVYNAQHASDKALAVLRLVLPEGKPFPASPFYAGVQADVYFEQGIAYQAKGLPDKAIETYSRALEFDPNCGEAHRQLAELYLTRGDTAHAIEHATAAEKLGTSIEPALRGRIFAGR